MPLLLTRLHILIESCAGVKMINLHKHIGIAGVDKNEGKIAKITGAVFEFCSVLVIYTIAIQWEMYRKSTLTLDLNTVFNWGILVFFVLQISVLIFLVRNKKLYLRQNWMVLVLIFGGIGLVSDYLPVTDVLQHLRPLLVLYLLIPFLDAAYRSLSDNRLGTTLVTAILIMVLSGIFIAGIDPAIPTPMEGIWWAWVTMSTVGYGDVVPVSNVGRIFGALLILMGLALFSVITANFSKIFIEKEMRAGVKEVKRESEEIHQVLKELHEVRIEEANIESHISKLQARLDEISEKLDDRNK